MGGMWLGGPMVSGLAVGIEDGLSFLGLVQKSLRTAPDDLASVGACL